MSAAVIMARTPEAHVSDSRDALHSTASLSLDEPVATWGYFTIVRGFDEPTVDARELLAMIGRDLNLDLLEEEDSDGHFVAEITARGMGYALFTRYPDNCEKPTHWQAVELKPMVDSFEKAIGRANHDRFESDVSDWKFLMARALCRQLSPALATMTIEHLRSEVSRLHDEEFEASDV